MYNPLSLEGKSIIVTGASSGLGRTCSLILSLLGARIILVGRDETRLRETLESLEGVGHGVEPFDLEEIATIPGWMKELSKKYGPFDGMVHSAGIALLRPLKILKPDDYTSTIRINLDAASFLAKGFRQKGVCSKPSSIVFLSSISGMVGLVGLSSYCASKAGLIGLTRSLAMELAREEIRVNCISPGYVKTEMTDQNVNTLTPEQMQDITDSQPLGMGGPEDVAHAIAYLLAETGKWITGSNLVVDGGATAHN